MSSSHAHPCINRTDPQKRDAFQSIGFAIGSMLSLLICSFGPSKASFNSPLGKESHGGRPEVVHRSDDLIASCDSSPRRTPLSCRSTGALLSEIVVRNLLVAEALVALFHPCNVIRGRHFVVLRLRESGGAGQSADGSCTRNLAATAIPATLLKVRRGLGQRGPVNAGPQDRRGAAPVNCLRNAVYTS